MSYLVDSDWVIDFLKGQSDAVDLFRVLAPEGVGISILTYGEVLEGIIFSRAPRAEEDGFRDFLRGVGVMPLTREAMRLFAEIRGNLRRAGTLVADMDLLIASTALAHGLTMVTRNRRHFERIPGLELHQSS